MICPICQAESETTEVWSEEYDCTVTLYLTCRHWTHSIMSGFTIAKVPGPENQTITQINHTGANTIITLAPNEALDLDPWASGNLVVGTLRRVTPWGNVDIDPGPPWFGSGFPNGPCPGEWEHCVCKCGWKYNPEEVMLDLSHNEVAEFCGPQICPKCGRHLHCGGCV